MSDELTDTQQDALQKIASSTIKVEGKKAVRMEVSPTGDEEIHTTVGGALRKAGKVEYIKDDGTTYVVKA